MNRIRQEAGLDVSLLALRVLVAFIFLWHGVPKAVDPAAAADKFVGFGLPGWLGPVTGGVEVVTGVLLAVGFAGRWAAGDLRVIIAGGLVTDWLPVVRRAWSRPLALLIATFVVSVSGPGLLRAQDVPAPRPCDEVESFHRLDFWVGRWEVFADDRKVGDNRIEKILGGCALVEHWRSVRGGEGRSLFYHVPATGQWKQVWVTRGAIRPGGVKEKALVSEYEGPGVRFRGRIRRADGESYLDRTTLVPLGDGRVRQVIETSVDGRRSWRTAFDAIYVPVQEEVEEDHGS